MDIPHLRAAGPQQFAARLFPPLHQPGVRRKLLHPIESTDVMDFVQDRQRQHFPNTGDRSQAVKGIAVVAFRVAHDRQLEVGDLEERFRRRFHIAVHEHLAGGVENANVHRLHVETDSAIVAVLTVVESHRSSSCAVAHSPCVSLLASVGAQGEA
jgi:hypothetical protein